MKILFLLKKNNLYGNYGYSTSKSGLLNSARITAEELTKQLDVETDVRVCVDANSIDREIRDYSPDIVIIEAIWVLPTKFIELKTLYPELPFIVRIHSEIPFLAMEGEAISRIHRYVEIPDVFVAFNSLATFLNFSELENTVYLPNIYHFILKPYISFWEKWKYWRNKQKFCRKGAYHIGCFGAIRPLKNQLLSAFAAIEFGDRNDAMVFFHINFPRVEQGGESVLKNIRALFKENPQHLLVEHNWEERDEFLETVGHMEIGLQLSFNESFNIVTADFVKQCVPIVVSSAIDWMPEETKTNSELVEYIVDKMEHVLANKRYIVKRSREALANYNKKALKEWKRILQ